jgi:hypothetical protein
MSPAAMPGYEWPTLPRRKLEQGVGKLQTRIFRASPRGVHDKDRPPRSRVQGNPHARF